MINLMRGDCLDVLKSLDDNSVDSVVTDPPYGLGFMGKKWDIGVPAVEVFIECLRVLKPGGHLLAFGGSRTYHRLAVAVEDAGFEIRDQIMWVYGSGFPKSQNVSKAIDKAAGAEREVVGDNPNSRPNMVRVGASVLSPRVDAPITAPATEAARQWDGWGTALKPAHEPIVVARKPLAKGNTVAANVLAYGTGAINIDRCRVGTEVIKQHGRNANNNAAQVPQNEYKPGNKREGRWPANLIHDGSEEVVGLFPVTKSGKPGIMRKGENSGAAYGAESRPPGTLMTGFGDAGSAARFFYSAKTSKKDRGEDNKHPTVKPTDLMRYLCRMVTPPGGVVLDPFMGSGSTGKAAKAEGFGFIGIELDPEYFAIAEQRIKGAV